MTPIYLHLINLESMKLRPNSKHEPPRLVASIILLIVFN